MHETVNLTVNFCHLFGASFRYKQNTHVCGVNADREEENRVAQENKMLINDFLNALSGRHKPIEVIHRYVAETDDALRHHILHYETAFPRFELVIKDMNTMGDCVLVDLSMIGTHGGTLWFLPPTNLQSARPILSSHHGDFFGLASTGKQINLPMKALYRVCNDVIVEHRMHYDANNLLQQLYSTLVSVKVDQYGLPLLKS